ncbi:MAG: PIG-L family deacetylase [Flammeovirgaceae bacterium]|nr:PIG-L family deacetylase [Flammeovirgaceae bacterium]
MRFVLLCLLLFFSLAGVTQNHQPSSSQIKLKLKKLNFLGSVLYVAAHPDDENTRVITYLSNDRLAATGYLSMTRGDGGQNLIGPEIGELLGLIRTQELLAARRIDGGQQFFTRAIDFGFSKNYQETLEIWNKDEILSDVVKVIRQFQPDVILTRFPPDERAGHGHHTSSAILAQEAFDLTNNSNYLPDQVKEFGVWQVNALYTNTGRWWNQTINENTPGIVSMNVGTYSTLLGKSYTEMAADSRTQHKSQGFGSAGQRGDAMEYFEYIKGDKVNKDIFEKINTTWTRVDGGDKIQPLIQKCIQDFNEENPAASIPQLLTIHKQISSLKNSVWKNRKLQEVNQLIQDCAGLYLRATASEYMGSPGQPVRLSLELINRSPVSIEIKNLKSESLALDSSLSLTLKNNDPITIKSVKNIARDQSYSSPYWLTEPHTAGSFTVEDKSLIGKPENDPAIQIGAAVLLADQPLLFNFPLVYQWTDPVKGELTRPFEVVPPVFVNFSKSVIVFNDQSPQTINIVIKSGSTNMVKGILKLDLPVGWNSDPGLISFELNKINAEQTLSFKVVPGADDFDGTIRAIAEIDSKQYSNSLKQIHYDHIPIQTLLPNASIRALRMNIKKEGSVVGYIAGAGDEIPASLRNLGYEVWEMKNEEVTALNLKRVDAVVLGIRALNTNERIRFTMPILLDYVKSGGTLVIQYNTSNDLEIESTKFSPYPITLSRERVTQENSEVRILKPNHPALNHPNKITVSDFEGWVQERGLYFPSTWSDSYEALLSMNDQGEPARNGSLLVGKYGERALCIYRVVFFELPEGCPVPTNYLLIWFL